MCDQNSWCALEGAAARPIGDSGDGDCRSEGTRNTADNLHVGIYEVYRPKEGEIRFGYMNAAFREVLGLRSELPCPEIDEVNQHFHPDDIPAMYDAIIVSEQTLSKFRVVMRLKPQGDECKWVQAEARARRLACGGTVWFGVMSDISDQIHQKQALEDAASRIATERDRLKRIADNVPGGIYETRNYNKTERVELVFSNPQHDALTGIPPDRLRQDASLAFAAIHPDDIGHVVEVIGEALDTLETRTFVYRYDHPTQGMIWIKSRITPLANDDGTITCYGWVADISESTAREEELREAKQNAEETQAVMEVQAMHDSLTGLPNRRNLDRVLSEFDASSGTRPLKTIIRIDLDHFKLLNDTHGHEAGDAALCHVARQITEAIGPDDFPTRVGGDEFAIVLGDGQDEDDALRIAQDITLRLRHQFYHNDRPCRIGISFGIASSNTVDGTAWELMSSADSALYEAKSAGRNRTKVMSPARYKRLLRNRGLIEELDDALEMQQFVPFFQPQVDATTHELVGIEVLARWKHPRFGMITPAEFLPLAAQMRLVAQIDASIFKTTIGTLKEWETLGVQVPKASFNVSAGRLRALDLAAVIEETSDIQTPIAFELLETILLEEEDQSTWNKINAIREAGFRIEIDDFGSGHASLIGLTQVRPDALKIDKRLIDPLEKDRDAMAVVSAIIAIGESLGIATVAEGVETMSQARILRSLGCQTLQGYAFGKPMSAMSFMEIMDEHKSLVG